VSVRIKLFDTTLRDGEQSPGAAMTVEQKVEMAMALERLGIDHIEAGFPVSSPAQFEATRRIADTLKDATVVALARLVESDIDSAFEALSESRNKMLHVFIATSPVHREYKLKTGKEELLETISEKLTYARKYFERIEFSPEDASRTERSFLIDVIRTAIGAGATTVNIPDTVGFAIPTEFGDLIAFLRENIPEFKARSVDLSVHCHNDLGLAVSNSLAAIQNGANQVEVTVNGIGERAGNCSLEELVMALKVRSDIFACRTGVNPRLLYPTSKLLQYITGFVIAKNKPIFGDNVFSHESGIHQDGVLKNPATYEIMDPEEIGRTTETLIMGRHSGKHSFRKKLQQYGISLPKDQFERAFSKFMHIADAKKEVFDEDIFNIIASILGSYPQGYQLNYFHVYTGNTLLPTAAVKIKNSKKEYVSSATGDGPIDALFRAIDSALGLRPKLREYMVNAIASGKDAQGQVKVTMELDGKQFVGRGTSTDITEASALAYINALNRHFLEKCEPESLWETR